MVKLIKKIGFFAYTAYLWRLNSAKLKKIIFFIVVIAFSFLMYPDLRSLVKDMNLNYLIHVFLLKWFLVISLTFLIYKQLRQVDWSLSAKKIYQLITESNNGDLGLKKNLKKIEDIKDIEEGLSKYRDIKKYPKLKNEIEQILEGNGNA